MNLPIELHAFKMSFILLVIATGSICITACQRQKTENKTTQNPANGDQFSQREKMYLQLLSQDPKDFKTNYNLASLYYNKAIELIVYTDSVKYQKLIQQDNAYEYPLKVFFENLSMEDLPKETYIYFKKALQYFEAAYQINPHSKNLLSGMAGCYFALGQISANRRFE